MNKNKFMGGGGGGGVGGSVRPFLLSKTAFFEENPRKNTQNHPKPPRNHPKTTQNYEKCTSEHQFLFFSDFLGFRVRKCQKGGYTGSLSVADTYTSPKIHPRTPKSCKNHTFPPRDPSGGGLRWFLGVLNLHQFFLMKKSCFLTVFSRE